MNLEPAARLLLLALRERTSDCDQARFSGQLQAAAGAIRDWDQVVMLAAQQRVMAYLEAAARDGTLSLPPEVRTALQRARFVHAASRLRLESELARIVADTSAASVPILVLKGPGLARTIYRKRDLRPYGDIDVTIQDRHESAVISVLRALGYAEHEYEAEVARREHGSHGHDHASFHRMFRSPDSAVLVEVHLDPLQLGLRPTLEAERWSRAQPLPGVAGALMLGWEDQLVQLCVHAHKHGWNRLIWLKDVDLLLRVHGRALDWELIQRTASAEGVSASVWYTLRLTRQLLGAPVSDPILARFRPALPIQLAYRWVWPTERIANLGAYMRRRAVQFHAAESWAGMIPSLILMGRRADRARATLQGLHGPGLGRWRLSVY